MNQKEDHYLDYFQRFISNKPILLPMKAVLIITLLLLIGCTQTKTDNYQDTTMDAIMSNKVSKCDRLMTRDMVITCYTAYATAKKDITVCDKIDESHICINRYNDLMK
jgi:hypothetical protein